MANKAMQMARETVTQKCQQIDFAVMSKDEYSEWINGLPLLEFMALLDIHREFVSREKNPEPEPEEEPPYTAIRPHTHNWIDYPSFGEMPVSGDTIVWVTYDDAEVGGPNRADAFLWGGPVGILAYAIAIDPKPRKADHA